MPRFGALVRPRRATRGHDDAAHTGTPRGARRSNSPLPLLLRGCRRAGARFARWYRATPPERRRVTLGAAVVAFAALCYWRYGPALLLVGACVGACRLGYERAPKPADVARAARESRLQTLYNGLVPYLADEHDPERRFVPGGSYTAAFVDFAFGTDGALTELSLRYSTFFRDGDAESRARVERAIEGKLGRRGEYLYDWDESANLLVVKVLPPLPASISGAPWQLADAAVLLGFTDATRGVRRVPATVTDAAGESRRVELTPVTWHPDRSTGARHLLVCGGRGTGKSNALRSIATQALAAGHMVAVIDAGACGAFGGLGTPQPRATTPAERGARTLVGLHGLTPGFARVETDTGAALQLLDWFARRCARRVQPPHITVDRLKDTLPTTPRRTLWLIIDELPALCDAAFRLHLPDPQDIISALMRGQGIDDAIIAIGCDTARIDTLDRSVIAGAGTRVGLGRITEEASVALFDGTLDIGGAAELPPGRGYARRDAGPVMRLQVPHAGGTGATRGKVRLAATADR